MSINEKDKLRPHEVDGIQEYDNPLPGWWLWLFILCIIFSIGYMLALYVFNGPTLIQEYERDIAAIKANQAAAVVQSSSGAAGETQQQDLTEKLKKPELISAGKELYTQNCAPCHGDQGQGVVGPNLTDKFWIHGGAPDQVIHTVEEGVPAKGMIAWKPILGTAKIEQVTAYVLSLQGTNPAGAKAAEGEPYPKE